MKTTNIIITATLITFSYLPFCGGLAWAQNIGINTTGATPNASAGLDIDFTNKGLLIPRVSLTGTADITTIASAATSLLVYNTATVSDVTSGYYYWNGSAWILLQQRTPTIQIFTSSDTWAKPAGVTKIRVRVVGGGAGGGGNYGGGGGGGGYSEQIIDVSSIPSVTVTVGAGGGAETNGGTTSFGSYCSATGGSAGINGGNGGASGVGSGGDINIRGCAGSRPSVGGYCGDGGSSALGGGGGGNNGTGGEGSGGNYGGGGAGGSGGGFPGAGGLVIVDEY